MEVIKIIYAVIRKQARFTAIKQNFSLRGNHDLQSKVLLTIFVLLAELERDLISERTRQALASKKARGVKLGRPRGSLGRSKLDSKVAGIPDLLKDKASHAFIARRLGVSRPTLVNYLYSRKILSRQ